MRHTRAAENTLVSLQINMLTRWAKNRTVFLKFVTPVYGDAEKRSVYENVQFFVWNNVACLAALANKVIITGYTPLPSDRQHLSYDVCLEVKREYYQNCSVLGCVTQCSQSAAHSCEQFLQVQQIGFVTLEPLRHA